ncbi:DUF2268 domain-containing protein [Peribacillus glennii]|uniref:DUF2268 domain-containing protein n=1 Tax=Peribacillus glennii TaxID=2303991 RepID=A0A372LEK5_9BACI|nr:DUF2268 domain-containing putative Zn-dependent protease [Peribacillus glennii]RFU64131.1 hypothetical protein D0466_09385 [Peribacillus glennii]
MFGLAVIDTKEWLENDFTDPVKIASKCSESLSEENSEQFYRYLKKHGMYSPSSRSKKDFHYLLERDIWGKTEHFFNKYKDLWDGFDVPIYIFPLRNQGVLGRAKETKSGLAFKDRMFLFVSPGIIEEELEAVFVHEYHHVCRLNRLKKQSSQSTLLDSIIMEGLAEHAVSKHVGKEHVAGWTRLYSEQQLVSFYEKYLKDRLGIKRSDELHDALLLGKSPYPSMLGYCTGYYLVSNYGLIPIKKSFTIPSRIFVKRLGDRQ